MAVLIAYRSYVIPMTHDEASTWLNYRHINVWSCISNAACWGTANNHWLNTLLLQWSASLFGDVAWALRLPNVLAGIGYIFCSALISARYIKSHCLQFAGFLLLCGHVYLLDFFSLARGYGLMASGVIWAIYTMLRYLENYDWRWLVFSLLAISFAILGNFTALLPWSAMVLGWFIWMLANKKINLLIRHGLLWFFNACTLFFLLHFPIKTLSGSGEFEWGSHSVWETAKDLMISLIYGNRFLGENTSVYLLAFLALTFLSICIVAILNKKYEYRSSIIFISFLLILNVLVIILQQKLTASLAPIGRKSIYFIPFIFTLICLGLALIRNVHAARIVGVLLSIVLVYNIVRTIPIKSCREWYYDAYYPELLSTLLPAGSKSDSIRLSTTWIFNPALTFYQKTVPLPIGGLPYQRPLVIDTTMQYYYVEPQDTVGMTGKGFLQDKKIGPFYLLKNVRVTK